MASLPVTFPSETPPEQSQERAARHQACCGGHCSTHVRQGFLDGQRPRCKHTHTHTDLGCMRQDHPPSGAREPPRRITRGPGSADNLGVIQPHFNPQGFSVKRNFQKSQGKDGRKGIKWPRGRPKEWEFGQIKHTLGNFCFNKKHSYRKKKKKVMKAVEGEKKQKESKRIHGITLESRRCFIKEVCVSLVFGVVESCANQRSSEAHEESASHHLPPNTFRSFKMHSLPQTIKQREGLFHKPELCRRSAG